MANTPEITFNASQAVSRKPPRHSRRHSSPDVEASSRIGAPPRAPPRAPPPAIIPAAIQPRTPLTLAVPMPAPGALPLLICSIGNPGSIYANTLHSAGHTVLNRLAAHLGAPAFQKDRSLGDGLVTKPPPVEGRGDWTLWQSTAYMNESGKRVRAAWNTWSRALPSEGGDGRLVVVYDELERPLGSVTVRTNAGASAKGHNGLKSIMATMAGKGFVRIGVGIGRPESRESGVVSRYVLRKMTVSEKGQIEGAVEEVVGRLGELGSGRDVR
ncbi:uncharacterized protein LTR77_008514 [Saxophila tyrrhenica]|uniref:peptidyl-tRNA hydrolase n=1 Tax=Saxophila tyrrhenica TaxID=1690608 RepID=A0AAV9P1Q2_9PEZI|nr:hypothetical protein LTR77_008514 [Saxophila tyrrhenica]